MIFALCIGITTIAAIGYSWQMLQYIQWGKKSKQQEEFHFQDVDQKHTIEILIPVRNDTDALIRLLHLIPKAWYHSIHILDDHSREPITQKLLQEFPGVKSTTCNSEFQGKKAAIAQGIHLSKAEWILTCDADIIPPTDWLEKIQVLMQSVHTNLWVLPVQFESGKNVLSRFCALDMAGLQWITKASIQMGSPLMCNGAHLLFRKSIWQEVQSEIKGKDWQSGDDTFLLYAIHQRYPGSIHYASIKALQVKTPAPETWMQFIQQRIRWGGKNQAAPAYVKMQWIFPVFFCIGLIVSFMIALGSGCICMLSWVLGLGIFKGIIDFVLLRLAVHNEGRIALLKGYPMMQIIHILYIGVTSILIGFGLGSVWKGRTIRG